MMISLGIVNRKSTENKHTTISFSGGYVEYFNFFLQYRKMRNTTFVKNNFSFYQKIQMDFSIFFQCLFKPLLWIFHKVKYMHFTMITDTNRNGYVEKDIKVYTVNITTYLFRVIPVWYSSRNHLTKSEIEEYTEK